MFHYTKRIITPKYHQNKREDEEQEYFISFSFVTKETILNELRKLNPKKACQESDIPVKIIKENLDIVSNFVYNNFNNSLFSSNFPSHLKNATITPIFKKKDRANVENYRPVSICLVYRKYMKGVCTFKFMNT